MLERLCLFREICYPFSHFQQGKLTFAAEILTLSVLIRIIGVRWIAIYCLKTLPIIN